METIWIVGLALFVLPWSLCIIPLPDKKCKSISFSRAHGYVFQLPKSSRPDVAREVCCHFGAADGEFYIRKSKVALADISERVRALTGKEAPDERIVFIKGEPSVKYATLSLVISQVKDAEVSRIEIVPNKKKVE